jgi:LPS sulfotransferase NodH
MTSGRDLPERWLEPVFVFTTGRSGSTLLLRYINCFAGLVVWGEHGSFLSPIARAMKQMRSPRQLAFIDAARPLVTQMLAAEPIVKTSASMTIEWANGYTDADIVEAFRCFVVDMLTRSLDPSHRWGFKEIRYGETEHSFLAELFSKARFIVLIRNPADVIRSQFTNFAKGKLEQVPALVARADEFLRYAVEALEQGQPSVRSVLYEEMVADPLRVLGDIADFIEEPLPVDKIRAIAGERGAVVRSEPAMHDLVAEIDILLGKLGVRGIDAATIRSIGARYAALRSLHDRTTKR